MTEPAENQRQVRLQVQHVGKINYAFQQNDVPLIRELSITNDSSGELRDLILCVEVESGVARPWRVELQRLGPGEIRRFTTVDLRLDGGRLANQLERDRTRLLLTVLSNGEMLHAEDHPIEVLAFNQWPGARVLPEIISAFVCPNHPAIEATLDAVHESFRHLTGTPSLDGYQSNSPDRARKMVAAVYAALKGCRIRYINPPASFDEGQKIRTPDEVLRQPRSGTCLDLSVVAAALLEQIGLHPVLLFPKGHAFVGAWLTDTQSVEPVLDDASRLANRVRLDEMVVFETTLLVEGTEAPFEAAVQAGLAHLERGTDFQFAIDVGAARRMNVLPLPPRVQSGSGYVVVETGRLELREGALAGPVREVATGESPRPSRAKAPRPLPAGLPPDAIERLQQWKRRLLDLSLRNPLLNFKEDSSRGVSLLATDIARLEDRLMAGTTFSLAPRTPLLDADGPRQVELERQRTGRDLPAEVLAEEFQRGLLRVGAGDGFERRLTALYREARTTVEETGSGTLYLALGALKWFESPDHGTPRLAPLLLIPARLERPQAGQFRLAAGDGDPTVNVTLIEKLRQDFQLDARGLLELDEDDSGIDVPGLVRRLRQIIKDVPRWEVRETAFLGHFSFAKFMLYADLDERVADVVQNPTINFILTRNAEHSAFGEFPSESDIDQLAPETSLCPLDADSSQQVAVEAACGGRTFVLQGPPGTGKSQTITNLIARATAAGQRVLFVAEKLAALNVVRGRLDRVGLGPFVLELHSHKASKKAVLDQIRAALEAPPLGEPIEWRGEVARLHELRRQLNCYVETLHTRHPSGETVYDVVSRLNALPPGPVVRCPFPQVLRTTTAQLQGWRSTIELATRAAQALGQVTDHPLRGIGLTEWRLDLAQEIASQIDRARPVLDTVEQANHGWLAYLGLTHVEIDALRVGPLQVLYDFTRVLLRREGTRCDHFAQPDLSRHLNSLTALVDRARQFDTLRGELDPVYRPEFLEANHAALIAEVQRVRELGFFARLFQKPALMRSIRALVRPGGKPDLEIFVADCRKGAQARLLGRELAGTAVHDGEWRELEAEAQWVAELLPHLKRVTQSAETGTRLRTALSRLLSGGDLGLGRPGRVAAEQFLREVKHLHQVLQELKEAVQCPQRDMTGNDTTPVLATLREVLQRWREGLEALPEWIAWQGVMKGAEAETLRPLLDALMAGELTTDRLRDAFEEAYARNWLGALITASPVLQRFSQESHTRIIDEFRSTDRGVMELSRRVLAQLVGGQRPAGSLAHANAASEMGLLRRQLQLQRGHKSVRRLVRELPTILPKLKPVWLMSPLSVAQFLDPSTPPFDLVVFDEASQIPVWDAIGALARGKVAVVVGDSRQLPPTNFFQRQEALEGDDELALEELESILDECVASNIPELRLRWHYRSRHESLIAFSNHQYYGNRLHTFPSADASTLRLGVSLRYLPEAVYDRGGTRQNQGEAEAIVAEIFLRLEQTGQGSIGVVTFSAVQQKLVEDLIDAELARRPEFKSYFDPAQPEYVFVKNLENVQGDERDVILFSICYGRGANGRLSMSFGPLNGQGGERRLNVAITRARVQVVVFSSIQARQIDLSRTRSRGVADLRAFLDFAERGPEALREVVSGTDADPTPGGFEATVARFLCEQGYAVDTLVGCSGYRLDLAIRDPRRPGRYLLGIECDGAGYRDAASARDRDRLRDEVLRGLGWRLHRVWSTDWLRDRRKAQQRLVAAIDAAHEALCAAPVDTPGETKGETPPAPASEGTAAAVAESTAGEMIPAARPLADLLTNTDVDPLPIPGARPYVLATLPDERRPSSEFHSRSSDRLLRADIETLVSAEAPIHVEELTTRVVKAWGWSRVTRKAEERVEELLERLGLEISPDQFIRRSAEPVGEWFRLPAAGQQRDLQTVAPEELAAAVRGVLTAQGQLPMDALVTEVARLFGYSRVREPARTRLRLVAQQSLGPEESA